MANTQYTSSSSLYSGQHANPHDVEIDDYDVRHEITYDSDIESFYTSRRIQVISGVGGDLITKQEFKDECDIDQILKQFSRTGILEHITAQEAAWLELPDQMDFQESLIQIEAAEAAFNSLPSLVREKYHNSPAEFLGALVDPSQKEYLTEVGIFAPGWVAKEKARSGAEPSKTAPEPAPNRSAPEPSSAL